MFGQRERPGQPGDPAGRPGADRAGQGLRRVRQAGLGQRRGRRGLVGPGGLAGRPGQLLVHGDGLADRAVLVAFGMPCGSRWTTATAASSGKPNSLVTSASAWAAGDPGGISCGQRGRGGRVQRRQEHDRGGYRRRPPADDEPPQAHDHERVAPGQQAHRRPRPAGRCRPAGRRGLLVGGPRASPYPRSGWLVASRSRRSTSGRSQSLALRLGEVVDGLPADGLLGEVGRHPGGDRR